MKRVTILASSLASAALSLLLGQACSSSDDSDQGLGSLTGAGGSAAPAPAGAGGSAAAPAPSNSAAAPAPGAAGASVTEGNPPVTPPAATGGTGNSNTDAMMGGAAGTSMAAGSGGGPPATSGDALCPTQDPSPSDGVTCTVTCTDPCGIKNLGERLCTCTAAAFDCAGCDYQVESPLLVPPTAPLPNCALSDNLQENDEAGCTDNDRCQSIGRTPGAQDGGDRFCGCLDGTWDCDSKPASFP